MYINQVIESADGLCPNEYTTKEKYMWCDELSAMLTQEYNKQYGRVRLEPDSEGTYLLPEGVSFEMIDRVFDGRHMIEKQDFRSYGVIYLSGARRRIALPRKHRVKGYIDAVYIKKHEPIRRIELEGVPIIITAENKFKVKRAPFEVGDVLIIRAGSTVYDNLAVLDVELENNFKSCSITVNDGAFLNPVSGMGIGAGIPNADVKRYVTDKTVCDAPYDSMYVDYVNAKICYYQRDYESYNQHMLLFNGKLQAYQAWLKEREPRGDDGKLKNWW